MGKLNDVANSNCPYKTIAYSLYVALHWDEISTHDCILRNPTEWIFLHFYYGDGVRELTFEMLKLRHDHDNRLFHFKHIVSIIWAWNSENHKHTEADPKKMLYLKIIKYKFFCNLKKATYFSLIESLPP